MLRSPIPKLKILTDPILKVFASGKKKEVLDELIKKCEESNVNYCFASMVQIVYPSGARYDSFNIASIPLYTMVRVEDLSDFSIYEQGS